MVETSISLLERLRIRPDPTSWHRLVDLYTPLIRNWLRRYLLQQPDVDDLVQEVLAVLVRELPQFQHDGRAGAFRSWLRMITVNRVRTHFHGQRTRPLATGDSDFERVLEQLGDPSSTLSRLWDEEHDRHVIRRLLEMIEPEFEPTTWQAFQLLVLQGLSTVAVAAELSLTPNAVRIAKSRVQSRLRQEAAGLID